jgi:urease accessory protein
MQKELKDAEGVATKIKASQSISQLLAARGIQSWVCDLSGRFRLAATAQGHFAHKEAGEGVPFVGESDCPESKEASHLKTMPAATATLVALHSIQPAFAHHVMDGELPATFWQGLLSGLGHPIIGIDHFAFIVGVGLVSYLVGRIAWLPLLFVAGTVLGCFIHLQDFDLPGSEAVIAFSLFVLATIVGIRSRIPIGVIAILFAAAGILHGYAYGESIVGAEPAPLGAYIAGFVLIQYGIAVISGAALAMIVARDYLSETTAMRTAGVAIAFVAAVSFAGITLG